MFGTSWHVGSAGWFASRCGQGSEGRGGNSVRCVTTPRSGVQTPRPDRCDLLITATLQAQFPHLPMNAAHLVARCANFAEVLSLPCVIRCMVGYSTWR